MHDANSVSLERVFIKEATDPARAYHSAHAAVINCVVQGDKIRPHLASAQRHWVKDEQLFYCQ